MACQSGHGSDFAGHAVINYTVTTVVTAASSYDLVLLRDLKADLAVKDSSQDAFLKRAISMCSAAVAQYCNRVIVAETVKDTMLIPETLRKSYQRASIGTMQASRWPIGVITSITEDGTLLVNGVDFTVDAENGQFIRLNPDSGLQVSWPAKPVVSIYVGGFNPIPFDIQDAVTRLVKSRIYARDRDPLLKADEVDGIGRQEFWVDTSGSGNMPPDVADLLDNYRVNIIS